MSFMSISSSVHSTGNHPVPEPSQVSMGASSTSSMDEDLPRSQPSGLLSRMTSKVKVMFSSLSDIVSVNMSTTSSIDVPTHLPELTSPTKRPRSPDGGAHEFTPAKRARRVSISTEEELDEVHALLVPAPRPPLKTAAIGVAEATPWVQLDLGKDESESEDPDYDPDDPKDHTLGIEALVVKNSESHFYLPYSWPSRPWENHLVDKSSDSEDSWDDEVEWRSELGDPVLDNTYDDRVFAALDDKPEDANPEEAGLREAVRQKELDRLHETGQAMLRADREEELDELEALRLEEEARLTRQMSAVRRPLRRADEMLVRHPFKPDVYLTYDARCREVPSLKKEKPLFRSMFAESFDQPTSPGRLTFEFDVPRRRFEAWSDFDY